VARAAKESHPREAIALNTGEADQIVEHRTRSEYATAALYLVRVRDLYQRLGDEATWQQVIGTLRAQKMLRALQAELTAAGL
jgi:uncharacterized Zn finger protein